MHYDCLTKVFMNTKKLPYDEIKCERNEKKCTSTVQCTCVFVVVVLFYT